MLASEEDDDPVVFEGRAESGKYVVVIDPVGRFVQHRRECQRGDDFFRSGQANGLGTTVIPMRPSCSRARSSWPPAMSSTARRRSWSTPRATASMDSRSIRKSAPMCSVMKTFGCRETGTIYSVNEANSDAFPEPYQQYLRRLAERPVGAAILVSLCRIAGRRLSSHFVARRRVLLSADAKLSRRASCDCSTKPTRLPSLPSRPGAWRRMARDAFWKLSRKRFISGCRCSWEGKAEMEELRQCTEQAGHMAVSPTARS